MARTHGKNTVITVDSNDLSTYTNTSTFNGTTDVHDTTGYGMNAKEYIGGLTDGTFSMGGTYDDAATGPRGVLKPLQVAGTAITVVRQPEGVGTGKAQDSFSAIVTSYEESSDVDDVVQWTCEFQISGDVTATAQI